MARSRNSVDLALRAALAPLSSSASRVAVAFSGGLDSTVLLQALVRCIGPDRVLALHVDHGLQPGSGQWVEHCALQAEGLAVEFHALRAEGSPGRGESIEAWARHERYRLLLATARQAQAQALLTAHHADDQLETLLMAMARGSGIDGLTGIAASEWRQEVLLIRPLLSVGRDALLADARARKLRWIDDPSNVDTRFARNAVRQRLMPVLRDVLPGLPAHLLSIMESLSQARCLLHEQARRDLAQACEAMGDWHSLNRRALAGLPAPRQATALREWLRELGCLMPGRERLQEMSRQLLTGQGSRGEVLHDGWLLLRHRDRLLAIKADSLALRPVLQDRLAWRGQSHLALACGGDLVFQQTDRGLAPDWLLRQTLALAPAGSAGCLRPAPGARARTLKNLWQDWGIPVPLRSGYPALWVGERLLMAAPFGMSHEPDWPMSSPGIQVRWQPPSQDPRARFESTANRLK